MRWHELEKEKPEFGKLCLCKDGGGEYACYAIAIYQDNSDCPWLNYDDGETFWAANFGQYWIAMGEIEKDGEK
jgi:hypothetical protein